MSWLWKVVTEAIVAFIATNIDDYLILLIFFSQVDGNFRRRHIVVGQYVGFLVITLASLPGFFGGLVVRREFIGFLGLLPIAIGIKQLVGRELEVTEVQTVSSNFQQSSHPNPIVSFLLSILHPHTYKVMAVTVANGGDNISIYVPLFAGHNLAELGVILSVFFLMLGVWCAIAYLLARQATVTKILNSYGKAAVPLILVGLGLYILYDRGTLLLVYQLATRH